MNDTNKLPPVADSVTDLANVGEKKKKSNANDMAFKEDFKYSHENPYHYKLSVFDEFVLTDDHGEKNQGSWSKDVFKNDLPLEVEIGTGYGHFMMDYTQTKSNINFIGLDHRFKRSYHLAEKLAKLVTKNFRYLRARGERLGFLFGEKEVSKVFYFFPDPWPKKRHHKKRLFQKTWLEVAHKVLTDDGQILVKTDHDGYFEWMLEELKDQELFKIDFETWDLRGEHPDHFMSSFITKFEKIFLDKGIKIKAMVLSKK